MLRDAQPVLLEAWWMAVAPAIALALLLFALALVADQLQERMDPRLLAAPARRELDVEQRDG
jgi:ABC-type dipeptide/oligopeptide/nickel transport system permease subunit